MVRLSAVLLIAFVLGCQTGPLLAPIDLPTNPEGPSPTYAFDLANTEVCDGVDNDNDGSIDEEQTGYTDFCDPSALVTPEGYPFVYPLEYWTSAFDALRYDTPNARDSYNKTLERAAAADPCTGSPHYYMHSVFKALLNMHLATGYATYLEESVELADLMIAASVVYDPSWAYPRVRDKEKFDAWVDAQGEIRFWSADQCSWAVGRGPGYRYMINELQGIRGIARLARTLQEQGDSRWRIYFDYADQVISFYAMMGDAVPRIDNANDKRVHYIMSALELYRASGKQRFLDWATALEGDVLGLTITEVDGDFLAFNVGIGGPINDVSHANRGAEMVRYWTEEDTPGTSDFMRRAVNTLLFRIWENQPNVQPANQYPHLFRNMTDGDNGCQGVNSPYRLGSIDVGWNELARYDRRVLYIMESFVHALVEGTAATSFPAPADCTLSGNTNYSYIITAVAELAYAHTYTRP